MAHIERRKLKTRISYRVRYVDPDGVEKSRSFRRKADAEDFATEVSHTMRAGSYVDPAAGRMTVQQYLEEWRLGQAHHRPSTVRATKSRFRSLVYPHIGHMPIGKVKPSTIRAWQKALLDAGKAPRTIAAVRSQVSGAFKAAILDKRIASNPFDGVKAPEIVHEKIVPRTVAQVRAGEAALPDRYRAIVTVDAGTGLRAGELFGLTVDRIDFLRGREITVDRQLVGHEADGVTPIFGPLKSKASYRKVPIGDVVIHALADHLRRYPAKPGELVFRTERGGPISRTGWVHTFAPAAAAMGLGKGEKLHHLRHFYASLLIADGRNVKEVQERLGDASAKIVLDTYSHLFPGIEDRTRDAVDKAFREPGDDAQTGEQKA